MDHQYISLLLLVRSPLLSVTGGKARIYYLQNGPAVFERSPFGGKATDRWALPVSAKAFEDLAKLPPCQEFAYFLTRGMINPYALAMELWAQFLREPDRNKMELIISRAHWRGTAELLELKKYNIESVEDADIAAMTVRRQCWDQMDMRRLRLTVINRRGMEQRARRVAV
jgi:hypothetical protein